MSDWAKLYTKFRSVDVVINDPVDDSTPHAQPAMPWLPSDVLVNVRFGVGQRPLYVGGIVKPRVSTSPPWPAAWVTTYGWPPIVSVHVRATLVGLGWQVTAKVSIPVPLVGLTVAQAHGDVAVHVQFGVVNSMGLRISPVAGILSELLDN